MCNIVVKNHRKWCLRQVDPKACAKCVQRRTQGVGSCRIYGICKQKRASLRSLSMRMSIGWLGAIARVVLVRLIIQKQKSTTMGAFFVLVETSGLEPLTPCMSSKYSNQLSYASVFMSRIRVYHKKTKKAREFFKKLQKVSYGNIRVKKKTRFS